MKHDLKYIMLLLGLLLGPLLSFGNASPDSTEIWSNEAWQSAKSGIEYQPKEKEKEEKKDEFEFEEFDSNKWEWDFNWLKSPETKTIVIIVAIIGLAFMLAYLLKKTGNDQDKKVNIPLQFTLEQLEEDVPESDFDKFLKKCIEQEDYKTAVRVLYLILLQQLHANEWIIWKKNKTNREFLNEIRGKSQYKTIRDLTLAFEIVWYGEQQVSRSQFDLLAKAFSDINASISNEKK